MSLMEDWHHAYKTREVPKALKKLLKKLAAKKPDKRLKPKDILKNKWLRSDSAKKKKTKKGKKEKDSGDEE